MNPYNPYAPPQPALPMRMPATPMGTHLEYVAEALRALNAHLADPAQVAADRKLARRFGVLHAMLIAMLVAIDVTIAALLDASLLVIVGSGLAVAAVFGGLTYGLAHHWIAARDRHVAPDVALGSFLHAMRTGRFPFAFACLSPTARARPAVAPSIPGVPSVEAPPFWITTPKLLGAYAQTFCRLGSGQVRVMRIKSVRVREVRGDVADVDVEAIFEAFPQWAQIVGIVLFVAVRLIGIIVGLVLYFSLRKRARLAFTKRLIRGSDGLWYPLDGSLFDGGTPTLL